MGSICSWKRDQQVIEDDFRRGVSGRYLEVPAQNGWDPEVYVLRQIIFLEGVPVPLLWIYA